MPTELTGQRRLDVIYCDDVRHEVGNKFSLMGVYTADMLLSVPVPAQIPKLTIFVRASTPFDRPFKSVTMHVEHNGVDAIAPTELSIPQAETPRRPAVEFDDPDWGYTTYSHILVLQLTPFFVETLPGMIKVYAMTDDGDRLNGRSLRLLPGPVPAASTPDP